MRRLSIVTATLSLALLVTSTSSFAADQYTYRAGQAYLKSAANNHTECEAQCQGDAACRGWNFVRPNPRSRSGICEFNARKAVPVSSPISMSGEINTDIDPLMSHAVPQINRMSGNTVRVGTPIMPKREIPKRRIAKRQMATMPSDTFQGQQKSRRIVRRMPLPGTGQAPAKANYQRTLPAQKTDVRTPRVYGSLEAPVMKPKLQQQHVSPAQLASRPRVQMTPQEIYRQQMLAVQRRGMEKVRQRAQQQMMQRPPMPQQAMQPMARPQISPQMMPQHPYGAPQQQPQQQRPQQMMTQQSSLYGSLHDDLTTGMTSVPRPQTAPDQVNNGDAPLATSRAVPTKPIQTEALKLQAKKPAGYPTIPGLAGG